jgi:NAD(P)-dependent dehydrogenase (short-subunit alcohol dehydrogenase family)
MRHAIVTGGSGLIGRVLCSRLIEAGWEVTSFDPKPGKGASRSFSCDISDEAAVTAAFAQLGDRPVDLLINNGGSSAGFCKNFADFQMAEWHETLGTYLTGSFLMAKAAVPRMAAGASIVNIVSTRAFMSEGTDFAYAAAKGGMIGLTQSLAIALGPKVRVNAIAPGWISGATDLRPIDHAQHPAGRVGRPDDIADAVLYLADAGFVTGTVLTIDGGMTRKMIYAE